MVFWRISRHLDLSGEGGLKAPGRWHHAGLPVVYLASSPASALLEACVHTSANNIPPSYTLLQIVGPTDSISTVEISSLPVDWTARLDVTREIGTEWLRSKATPLLQVPSAIVPETANYLLNPLHPGADAYRIEASYSYPFDLRLKQ